MKTFFHHTGAHRGPRAPADRQGVPRLGPGVRAEPHRPGQPRGRTLALLPAAPGLRVRQGSKTCVFLRLKTCFDRL